MFLFVVGHCVGGKERREKVVTRYGLLNCVGIVWGRDVRGGSSTPWAEWVKVCAVNVCVQTGQWRKNLGLCGISWFQPSGLPLMEWGLLV